MEPHANPEDVTKADEREVRKAKATEEAHLKAIEAVEALLGEPFPAELPENGFKVRRNLLAFSMVALAVTVWNASLDVYEGFKVPASGIREILALIIFYHIIHFGWYAWESLLEWKLRLTGSRVSHVTAGIFGAEGLDYPNDPRQSTLYNWWKNEARNIGNVRFTLDDVQKALLAWEEKLKPFKEPKQGDGLNFANAVNGLGQLSKKIDDVKNHVTTAARVIQDARIPASLKRFDDTFRLARKVGNARWITLELVMPIVFGLFAFYKLDGIKTIWHLAVKAL